MFLAFGFGLESCFFYFGFFWFSVEGFWSFVSGLRVFCIFFVWIWSVVFDSAMIQILALYLEFEGAKNIHVLYVIIIWGFGGCWRFLTGVWHLDLDLNMVTGP